MPHVPDTVPGKRVTDAGARTEGRQASRQTSEVGALCRKAARTVLCGGRPVMGVPTAIARGAASAFEASPELGPIAVRYRGGDALEIRLTGPYRGPDRDTFAFVPGLDFHDGTIEVDVAGAPLSDDPSGARGFVGIAFRIDEKIGGFPCEGLYIRPTNARTEDQVRRNHSTQYF